LDGADPRTRAQKLATYHAWMAYPLKPSNIRGPPHLLPGYLELELSRHVLRNIALFVCVPIPLECVAELKRVVGRSTISFVTNVTCMMSRTRSMSFLCPCLEMCYLRRRFEEQVADCIGRTHIGDTGAFYLYNIGAQTYKPSLFLSETMNNILSSWQCPASPAVNPSD